LISNTSVVTFLISHHFSTSSVTLVNGSIFSLLVIVLVKIFPSTKALLSFSASACGI